MTAVYLAKIPKNPVLSAVLPVERQIEISFADSKKVKAQKYYVWKLLEHALGKHFPNISVSSAKKRVDGKWLVDGVYFSLSHTENLVCVAVSEKPVGVDAQKTSAVTERAVSFVLSDGERGFVEENSLSFAQVWTMKEAIFKRDGEFSSIRTADIRRPCFTKIFDEEDLTVAVATDQKPTIVWAKL